jgi:AraC-like DNA-binding protein
MLPRKRQWVNKKQLSHCSFNIILAGRGYLRVGGDLYELRAPCMFTPSLLPGCSYGPHDVWSGLFIIYSDDSTAGLDIEGYLGGTFPVYQSLRLERLLPLIRELKVLIDDTSGIGMADRIDYICNGIVRESIMSGCTPEYDDVYRRMQAVRNRIRQSYKHDPDVVELAHDCRMSESTFRRNWKKYFGIPPKQYVLGIRMEQACALLVSGSVQIQEIARQTGFQDALYFSKVFRRHTGVSPREFRARYL